MPTTPLSFEQRLADDKAWFAENPGRSFRVQVVSDAEIKHFIATRDPANGPVVAMNASANQGDGHGVIVSFWRFISDHMKALDHLLLPGPPEEFIALALQSKGDAFPLGVLTVTRAVPLRDIVIRSPADITTIDLAA